MAWVKGQSGNPAGRGNGKKEACTRIFWNDMHDVWKAKGKAAVEKMADTHPNQFVDVMARVLPKDDQRREIAHSLEITLKQPDWLQLDSTKLVDVTPKSEDNQ